MLSKGAFLLALTLISLRCDVLAKTETTSHQEESRTSASFENLSPELDNVCEDSSPLQYDYTILVDPSLPKSKLNCDQKAAASERVITCPNISMALAGHFHRDSTVFLLASGPNVTHILKQNTETFFRELSDIGFFAYNSTEQASIECEKGAGLAFWNVDRIWLQSVTFSYCSALRNSTSKNLTLGMENDRKFVLLYVLVGLYFYNGTDVTMCHVTVQHGPRALGVLMYDTDGSVDIYHSNFINNTVLPTTESETGGGGFNVEFSYCVPGDKDCNESRRQATHNTNSSYVFYNSTFANNSAVATGAMRLIPHNETHQGLGRGGGLAVYFKNNATENSFQIIRSHFSHNKAMWGGGMCVVFGETSISNEVSIEGTTFVKNECHKKGVGGGGLRILSATSYALSSPVNGSAAGNKVTVRGEFHGNQALEGGAISFAPAYQAGLRKEQTTDLRITDSVFYNNSANSGAAVHAELNPLYVYGSINYVTLDNCSFVGNTIRNNKGTSSYDIGIGVVYTYRVPMSFQSHIEFSYNSGSALALTSTYIEFYGANITFLRNKGDTGGAIAFLGSSQALVNENTSMYFISNSARKGGAIYGFISGQGDVNSNTGCFIGYKDPFKNRREWNASFVFINNTSTDLASNSIYTSSVFPCAQGNIDENSNLTDFLLFCQNHNWKFVDRNCADEIQTEGSSYKFDSDLALFPGRGFNLPIQVYDDLGHDITNSVGYTSTILNSSLAKVDPKYTLTSDNYLIIEGKENVSVTLALQSSGSRPHYLEMNITLRQCPPGFYFETPALTLDDKNGTTHVNQGKCTCKSMYTFGKMLNCSENTFNASIPWNFWIGLDPTGSRPGQLVMGEMPNLYSEQKTEILRYRTLPKSYDELDEYICGIRNRTGVICGKCKENFSTSVNSYNYICTECDDSTNFVKNIFIFMAFAYLPYVILLGAIIYFNLKFTSSAVNGFILYAQMISLDIFDINDSSGITFNTGRLHKSYQFVYGLFNFNSFANVMKPFCIRRNMTALDVICLEYTLALLPLLLIVAIYFLLRIKSFRCLCCRRQTLSIRASPGLSRSRRRRKRNKGNSLVHTLVAFILLSYTKLTLVSMKILTTQKLFDKDGTYLSDPRMYLAGHLSFHDKAFLFPYGVIALVMMVLFAFIPSLFLLGFPQLVDYLLDKEAFSCFKRIWPTVTIHIFLDAFHGFYKPNRRIFAGIYFIFRLIILVLYVTTSNYLNMYIWQQVFITIMIVLLAVFKPYKREVFNIVDIFIFLNLSIINLISTYVYASSLTVAGLGERVAKGVYILQYILLWAPLIYMLFYLVYKLLFKLGITQFFTEKLNRGSQVYFNPNSEISESGRVQSDAEDGEGVDDVNSLSDSALFSRAKDTNKFRPAPVVRRHKYTSSLVDLWGGTRSSEQLGSVLSDDSESRSECDTETTENETNSR